MTTISEATAIMERARDNIQRELDAMTKAMGAGWLLDVDIGAIDVSTIEGRAWLWRVNIQAKLTTEARP